MANGYCGTLGARMREYNVLLCELKTLLSKLRDRTSNCFEQRDCAVEFDENFARHVVLKSLFTSFWCVQDLACQGYNNAAKEIDLPVERGPKKRYVYIFFCFEKPKFVQLTSTITKHWVTISRLENRTEWFRPWSSSRTKKNLNQLNW